jgi:tRNA wybutosine-synthesizing protein 4
VSWLKLSLLPTLIVTSDALPFQLLIGDSRLCQATTFVDIDYPSLMQTKVKIVNETEALRSVLDMHPGSAQAPEVLLRSEQYIAVGCDLREIERLQHILNAELGLSNCSFLILAEVSITYMETVAADAPIAFAAKLDDGIAPCSGK